MENNNTTTQTITQTITLQTISPYSTKPTSRKKSIKYCKVHPGCIWFLGCNCKNCKKLNL